MKRYTVTVNVRHTFFVDLPDEFFDADGQVLDKAMWDHDAFILEAFTDQDDWDSVDIESWEGELR